ncbi:MAG: dihydroxyacetone kinase subunit L [Candidatus Marinimicrobia bacterium]|jgi:dihydroxyacetone kinase-like protein|nr:dihydroxyacetone kinase subunit L [Candidatus Neomarinimicrobiota bacterium]
MINNYNMDVRWANLLITKTSTCVEDHKDLLTELDSKIGDADHGINMSRGFQAIMAISPELSKLTFEEALKKAGMTLLMKVGGASGPLFGSFLIGMSKATSHEVISISKFSLMFENGVADVKKRGKSDIGEKTMLDVLVPVSMQLKEDVSNSTDEQQLIRNIIQRAEEGLESTRLMRATKGRASFLGERSIGHLDPGAMTSCLLIKTICETFNSENE